MENEAVNEGAKSQDSTQADEFHARRGSLWMSLGERQYLLAKLSAECAEIERQLDALHAQKTQAGSNT